MLRLDIPLDELNLSTRTKNALHRAGMFTIEDLLHCNEIKLRASKGVGKKALSETECVVKEYFRKAQAENESKN